jgi:hypothetical protein
MGLGSFIWYGGGSGVFKALLINDEFDYFVGGDRPVPFGPLPFPATGPGCSPQAITATGPGLNDWVVAYALARTSTENTEGTNIAFANHLGIFEEIELAFPPPNGNFFRITAKALGVIMSLRSGFTSQPTLQTERWITSDGSVGGSTTIDAKSRLYYRLPGLLILNNSTEGSDNVTPDHTLSYAFSLQTDSQSLYFADLSFVNITPPIPDLTIGTGAGVFALTDDLKLLHLSSTFNNDLIITARNGGNLAVSIRQWQLYPDGTWQALSNITNTFQGGAGGYGLQFFGTGQRLDFYPS